MFRTVVARVKSTMTVVLGIPINRVIYDTVSVNALGKDVDALILGSSIARTILHRISATAYCPHQGWPPITM